MGGCRCSYRNCKVKSDGQTHMFHFPVFDKIRCHQWITNSLKPNFLNLKLSQLKNRVICQHHFRDENFMNFRKDKLKTDAVPTEDGHYCTSEPIEALLIEENDMPAIPINADDIENETLNSVEKKAHSSVKYGDFLISDVTELFNATHNTIDSQASQRVSSSRCLKSMTNMFSEERTLDLKSLNHEETHSYTIIYSNDQPTKVANPLSVYNTELAPAEMAIEFQNPVHSKTFEKIKPNKLEQGQQKEKEGFYSAVWQNNTVQTINPDKVVKIISEKTISEPVKVEGKLEPISPSMIIRRPARKCKSQGYEQIMSENKPQLKKKEGSVNSDIQASYNNNNVTPQEPTLLVEQVVPIEYDPNNIITMNENNQSLHENIKENIIVQKKSLVNLNSIDFQNNVDSGALKQNEEIPYDQVFLNCMLETAEKLTKPELRDVSNSTTQELVLTPTNTPVFKSILKRRISPEKLAAIEAKRKFNLKLRDVISSCLDNLDEQNDAIHNKISQQKRLSKTVKRRLPIEAPNPSGQDKTVAYLEARLKRMEDTLLNKIDYNTQKINELKRTLKPSSNVRHANTQTYLDQMTEISQKQYLYKEISKFLSPNANIKIYEELFLGKQEDDEETKPLPRKLRKRR